MSFTTIDEVAFYVNTPKDLLSIENTAQISAMILYVDGLINNYCGWDMLAVDYEDKRYSGNGSSELDLRIFPINELLQCRVRGTDGVFTDITADLEILEGGVLSFLPTASTMTSFPAGKSNIYVSFNAGYVDVPSELAYIATHLVSLNYNRTSQETFDMKTEGFEQKTTTYSEIEIPYLMRRALDRYRLLSVF